MLNAKNKILPIPEVVFDAFNGQYLKVSIGKGLINIEGLAALIERYAEFFPNEDTESDDQNGQNNGNHNGHHNGHRGRGRQGR